MEQQIEDALWEVVQELKEITTAFYYIRDADGHPRITICLLHDHERGETHRGIAIAMTEMPSKSDGRNRAEGRAWRAYYNNDSSEPVLNPDVADFILNLVRRINMRRLWDAFEYKASYDVELEEFEAELLRKVGIPI